MLAQITTLLGQRPKTGFMNNDRILLLLPFPLGPLRRTGKEQVGFHKYMSCDQDNIFDRG